MLICFLSISALRKHTSVLRPSPASTLQSLQVPPSYFLNVDSSTFSTELFASSMIFSWRTCLYQTGYSRNLRRSSLQTSTYPFALMRDMDSIIIPACWMLYVELLRIKQRTTCLMVTEILRYCIMLIYSFFLGF